MKTRFAALFWIASVQYFIVQWIVASAFLHPRGYSYANNTISDLGNTQCAIYGGRFVCSPLHSLMNASFIMLGITMILGAFLLLRTTRRPGLWLGYGSFVLGGIGTIIVGLYPENSPGSMHVIGAALPFVIGNVGMILIGIFDTQLRRFSIFCGSLGLAALVLFLAEIYLGLGIGGMERVTANPQTIWMIVYGLFLLQAQQRPFAKT